MLHNHASPVPRPRRLAGPLVPSCYQAHVRRTREAAAAASAAAPAPSGACRGGKLPSIRPSGTAQLQASATPCVDDSQGGEVLGAEPLLPPPAAVSGCSATRSGAAAAAAEPRRIPPPGAVPPLRMHCIDRDTGPHEPRDAFDLCARPGRVSSGLTAWKPTSCRRSDDGDDAPAAAAASRSRRPPPSLASSPRRPPPAASRVAVAAPADCRDALKLPQLPSGYRGSWQGQGTARLPPAPAVRSSADGGGSRGVYRQRGSSSSDDRPPGRDAGGVTAARTKKAWLAPAPVVRDLRRKWLSAARGSLAPAVLVQQPFPEPGLLVTALR